MSEGNDGIRKNGLQCPPHKLQILTWILFPVVLAHFFGFLRPLIWYPKSLGIALIVIFSFSTVSAVAAGYVTCNIDPADDALCSQVPGNDRRRDDTIYCYLCSSNVDKSSKHCRYLRSKIDNIIIIQFFPPPCVGIARSA